MENHMTFGGALEAMLRGERVRRDYPTTAEQGPSWADAGRSIGLEGTPPSLVQRYTPVPVPAPTFRASGPGPKPAQDPWLVLTPDLLAEDWVHVPLTEEECQKIEADARGV